MTDIYTRTRTQWAFEWGVWWLLVAVFAFLMFQLSRPLWDAPRLIEQKRQSCLSRGEVMVVQHVKFGDNYSCKHNVANKGAKK